MIYKQLISIILFLLLVQGVLAQNNQKIKYNPEMDTLWSRNTYLYNVTNDGNWIVMQESFGHKEFEILLKHTEDTLSFRFSKSDWVMFSEDSKWFGLINSNKELNLLNLETYSIEKYLNIQSYGFSKSGNYVAAIQKSQEEKEFLIIINLKNNEINTIEHVKKFAWHPKQDQLLLHSQENLRHRITKINLETLQKTVIKETEINNYNQMLWSDSGNSILFLEQSEKENFLNYFGINGHLKILDNTLLDNKQLGFNISNQQIYISKDGKKVLFYNQNKKELKYEENETMEVWDSNTPWVYPKNKDYELRENQYFLTAWYPETDKIIAIETEKTPTAALDVNQKYAIVYDQLQYEPLYKEYPNADIYVSDMETGIKNLVVENQYTGPTHVTISPYGNYIAYFKKKQWWVYDVFKKRHANITRNLNVSFANLESDFAGDVSPYERPAWTESEENIIIFDQYDIWTLTPDGKNPQRITKGREDEITYRINQDVASYLTVNPDFSSTSYNLNRGMLLGISDISNHQSGFAFWKKDRGVQNLIFEGKRIDNPLISGDLSKVFFRKQRFNEPISVYGINLINDDEYLIYQSNATLTRMDFGYSEHITYNWNNKHLTGALLYPANFNPQKKYAMIVYIYEKASYLENVFIPPTKNNYIGFSPLKYIINDYFVFYPDVSYTIGDPGVSALKCVTKAVNKVLELGFIDFNKIGLIGHSFGGYESAFIATQTDMFAAIVAGAAVTNFTSHYHGMGWTWNQPEMWRYESQQWRMGDSYYNIKAAYLRNSPMQFVENVNTPLLLWTGKEDYQVHWMQSIEMFLALKRLHKTSKLLLFVDEGHAVKNRINQEKLSNEIMNWFDKYCK